MSVFIRQFVDVLKAQAKMTDWALTRPSRDIHDAPHTLPDPFNVDFALAGARKAAVQAAPRDVMERAIRLAERRLGVVNAHIDGLVGSLRAQPVHDRGRQLVDISVRIGQLREPVEVLTELIRHLKGNLPPI